MLQITNIFNESCSPRLMFRWESNFFEDPTKFRLKKQFWTWKISNIFRPYSKSLIRYQKILWTCLFGYKNLLNIAWHSLKFHNCHYASVDYVRMHKLTLSKKYLKNENVGS